jgi:hypothetical protein
MKKIYSISALLFIYAWQLNAQGCSCCSANTGVFAGSSINDNAGLQTKNSWLLDLMYDYRLFNPYSSTELTKVADQKNDVMGVASMWLSSLRLSYGISNKLSVSALLPYISVATTANQKAKGEHYQVVNNSPTSAFADLSLFVTYLFYDKNSLKISAMGGVEFPTGKLPKDHGQIIVGSGSFDPLASLTASKQWSKFSVRTNLAYKLTTVSSNGIDYGDFLNYQLGVNYQVNRISVDTLNCSNESKKPMLFMGLTLLGENLHPIKESGILIDNTGFSRNFVSLNSTLSLKNKFAVYIAADVPITQNNYGVQNAASYRFRIGTSLKIN